VYYVKEDFDSKYDLSKMSENDRNNFNRELNYKYHEFLQNKCAKVMRQKQEINYKLYYYKNYPRYVESFQRELKNLDYHYCEKFNEFSHYVR